MMIPPFRAAIPPARVSAFLSAAVLVFGSPPAAATQQVGRIIGTVRDTATRRPVQGALVTVEGTARTRTATTNSAGAYLIESVPPGIYALRATVLGYEPQSRPGVEVFGNETTSVVFVLQATGLFVPPVSGDTLPTDSLRIGVPPAATVRYRQAEFRPSLLPLTPGSRVQLPLFDDVNLTLELQQIDRVSDTEFRWTSTAVDSGGARRGSAILVVHDGHVTGNIRVNRRLYQIRPQQRGSIHVIVEVDLLAFGPPDTLSLRRLEPSIRERPPFGMVEILPPERLALALQAAPGICTDRLVLSAGPIPEIRLLVLYSDAVADAVLFPHDEIALILAETNQAFDSSHVSVRVTPAHLQQVTVTDNGTIGTMVLAGHLRDPADNLLDDVHNLRNVYHADIVVLLVEHSSGGGTYLMDHVTPTFAPWAFAAVGRADAAANFTFSHELGHIMGARHQRTAVPQPPVPYAYNYGFVHQQQWHTIMALGSGNDLPANRFSNPEVAYEGVATGAPSTAPAPADNHRALANTAAVVASFRLTPVWFVSAGGASPWLERNVDEFPLLDLGFGDFNGDRETDVLRADGTGSWWVSLSGSGPWRILNAQTGQPVSELAFGDFDGDGETDAFRTDPSAGAWFVAWGGKGAWQPLNSPSPLEFDQPLSRLAFGDFDGDGKTDVFLADPTGGSLLVSSGGTSGWQPLNPSVMPDPLKFAQRLDELAFGDFNGNDSTEVFRTNAATGEWFVFEADDADWRKINGPAPAFALPRRDLAFGDFDGDHTTDVFRADIAQDRWLVSAGASAPWAIQNTSCFDLPALRFADFDGDGTTDVFRAGIRP